MHGQFANYQIGVEINRGLPRGCCEVTVHLDNELGRIQGWKKKIFICRQKVILSGSVLTPIHQTNIQLAIFEREIADRKEFEIQLNSLQIKLFKR